jgi:hypothetical protein
MRNILVLGLLAAFAASACDKGSSSNPAASGAAASGASPTTSAAPATGATLGPASLEVTWTGKWDTSEKVNEYPLMKVVNKDATRPLTFYQGFFYFYDHDKKQVGREFRDRYQFSVPPGQSTELGAGPKKADLPKGTEHIEFVVTGANFGSETDKFRIEAPPPEKRPMGG